MESTIRWHSAHPMGLLLSVALVDHRCYLHSHLLLRYALAAERALSRKNIESGFRKAGLSPLMSACQWLDA